MASSVSSTERWLLMVRAASARVAAASSRDAPMVSPERGRRGARRDTNRLDLGLGLESSSSLRRRPLSPVQPSTPVAWCGAPTGLLCEEPRCRRYTARTAMEPTARNSLCQFCRVRDQKSALWRYCGQLMGFWSCWSLVSLKAAQPAIDWVSHETRKIVPMTSAREEE